MMKYFLLTAAAFSIAAPAAAQSSDPNDGTGYIGASIFLNSEYMGSADEDVRPLPYLSFQNVKGFDLFGTTLSYRLIDTGTGQGFGKWSLRAGPSVGFQSGRETKDSVNLNGFEDVDGSLPLGGYIRSTFGPVGFGINAGKDVIGGHDGFTADASIGTFIPLRRVALRPSLSVNWADNKHNDSFFSVTPDQALSSGLAAYNSGAGIYSYSASVVSWITVEEKYAISLIGSYRWYTGDAADSPILNASDGSKNGLFAAISVSRKFDTSKW